MRITSRRVAGKSNGPCKHFRSVAQTHSLDETRGQWKLSDLDMCYCLETLRYNDVLPEVPDAAEAG